MPYGNVPDTWYTRCVLWTEGGNGRTVPQVTQLGDWDGEHRPEECWVVSQGSDGGHGKESKKEKKRKREKGGGGGTFRVPGDLLFLTGEEVEAYLREALEESDGDDRDDEAGGVDDKGQVGDKWGEEGGEEGGDKGGEKEGDTGGEKGVAGSKDAPPPPPCMRGSLRVVTRERGAGMAGGGLTWLIGQTTTK